MSAPVVEHRPRGGATAIHSRHLIIITHTMNVVRRNRYGDEVNETADDYSRSSLPLSAHPCSDAECTICNKHNHSRTKHDPAQLTIPL